MRYQISIQILPRLARAFHFNAKLVSRSWRAALTGGEIYKLRKELGTTEEWLYILTEIDGHKLLWHALDPVSQIWQKLPLMPNVAADEGTRWDFSGLRLRNMVGSSIIAEAIRGLLGRKHVADHIPFCGCAIGAVNGCLYVLGGFCRALAVSCLAL